VSRLSATTFVAVGAGSGKSATWTVTLAWPLAVVAVPAHESEKVSV
jgi:hypothetical protein